MDCPHCGHRYTSWIGFDHDSWFSKLGPVIEQINGFMVGDGYMEVLDGADISHDVDESLIDRVLTTVDVISTSQIEAVKNIVSTAPEPGFDVVVVKYPADNARSLFAKWARFEAECEEELNAGRELGDATGCVAICVPQVTTDLINE